MKLRISGNSVRLRLGREEVARVAAGKSVQERAELSPVALVCVLSTMPELIRPTASFADGVLSVALPAEAARRWAESEQVGIDERVPGAEGRTIRLLVEKDFKCLHGDGTDQPDAFPHPLDPSAAG